MFTDNILDFESVADKPIEDWVIEHRNKMLWAQLHASRQLQQKADKRKERNDLKAADHDISIGSRVLLRNRVKGRNKIQDTWKPIPYIITAKLDQNVYSVSPIDQPTEKRTINRVDLLVLSDQSDSDSDQPIDIHVTGERKEKPQTMSSDSSESEEEYMFLQAQRRPVDIEPDHQPVHTAPERRYPKRATAGRHSNPHNLPKSVLQESASAFEEQKPNFEDFAKAISILGEKLGQSLGTILKESYSEK
jgi:hypothetical protein